MKVKNQKGITVDITRDVINELAEKFYTLTHEVYKQKYGNDKRRVIASHWKYYYGVDEKDKYVSTTFTEQLAMKFSLTSQQVDEILGKLGYEKESEKRGYKLLTIDNQAASSSKKLIL